MWAEGKYVLSRGRFGHSETKEKYVLSRGRFGHSETKEKSMSFPGAVLVILAPEEKALAPKAKHSL